MGFGEAALTLPGQSKRNATVITREPTKCLVILKRDFKYVTVNQYISYLYKI